MRGQKIIWTDEMLRYLRDNYASGINAEIAGRMRVGESTLRRKARGLGLKKDFGSDEWRRAVGERASEGQMRSGNHGHRWRKGENPPGCRFRKGRKPSEEEKRKQVAARRRSVYIDLMRMKNGLPQLTKIRLRKRYYVDRKKWIKEEDDYKK